MAGYEATRIGNGKNGSKSVHMKCDTLDIVVTVVLLVVVRAAETIKRNYPRQCHQFADDSELRGRAGK